MKLDCSKYVLGLDDKPYDVIERDGSKSKLTVGEALSNILADDKSGGKMKCFNLARKAYQGKTLELDSADKKLIEEAIDKAVIYNNVISGQLLEIMSKLNETENTDNNK